MLIHDSIEISLTVHLADLTNLLALGKAIECIINSVWLASVRLVILVSFELKVIFSDLEQSKVISTDLGNKF